MAANKSRDSILTSATHIRLLIHPFAPFLLLQLPYVFIFLVLTSQMHSNALRKKTLTMSHYYINWFQIEFPKIPLEGNPPYVVQVFNYIHGTKNGHFRTWHYSDYIELKEERSIHEKETSKSFRKFFF